MSDWYVLDVDKTPRKVSLMQGAAALENKDRIVANIVIGKARISTIFLGLDHNYWGKGPPVLFETMIFGGPEDQYQERYSTWDEAKEGHRKAVKLVREY